MIVCSVIVVIVSHFAVSVTLLVLDGNAWSERLAIWDREARYTTAGLSLANVLANSNLDALVSK